MSIREGASDLSSVKSHQRETWAAGDFARIGNSLVMVGEFLCEVVDLRAGERVLDIASGSGNTAISAARRNCEVTGVDYVPGLVEYASRRAEMEHVEVTFEVGDAEELPYADASFDAVLSTFGVMFAPDQRRAADEMLRVCKHGGRIGLANWTPDGYVGDFFRVIALYLPPPPGIETPVLWGTEQRLLELLGEGVFSIDVKRREYVFRYASAGHYVEHFREFFGPLRRAFESLDEAERGGLERELEALLEERNVSGDGTLVVPAAYLEVVAARA